MFSPSGNILHNYITISLTIRIMIMRNPTYLIQCSLVSLAFLSVCMYVHMCI